VGCGADGLYISPRADLRSSQGPPVIFVATAFFAALPVLATGVANTLWLVLASMAIGSTIGLVACIGRLIGRGALNALATAYIAVFRGLPETVLVFWIYACGPLVFDARLS